MANSTGGISGKPIFSVSDGAPMSFVDYDPHQSTQEAMVDLPTTKAPKVNTEFPSNLEAGVSTIQFSDGEILAKFDGCRVYQQEAMTKENLPRPKAPKGIVQISPNMRTRVSIDLADGERVPVRFQGNDGYQNAFSNIEKLRGSKAPNVNASKDFNLDFSDLEANSVLISFEARQEANAIIEGLGDNLNKVSTTKSSQMNLGNPIADDTTLKAPCSKENQGTITKDSTSVVGKFPKSTSVMNSFNAYMNRSSNQPNSEL